MFKNLIKSVIPESVLQKRRRRIAEREQSKFAEKSVAETFSEIYEKNVWGGAAGEFFSGEGSNEKYAARYAEIVRKFIRENDIKRVVDLGCGDFRVASQFVADDFQYAGCDVVPNLIEHLNKTYGGENIEFFCRNIVEDELPDGDLCLIRQVLQHLSNLEIERILENVKKYKYLIVTEQYPNPKKQIVPNLDIPHGPDVRLHFDSAVFLDEPPFDLKNVNQLLDVEADEGTRIKSFLVVNDK
jgi:SAM-dependent methyltransferase